MCAQVIRARETYGADFINALAVARVKDAPHGKPRPVCDGLE